MVKLVWFLGFRGLVIQRSYSLSSYRIVRFAFGEQPSTWIFFSQLEKRTQTSSRGWFRGCPPEVRSWKSFCCDRQGSPDPRVSRPCFLMLVSRTRQILRVSTRNVSTTHVARFLPCWVRSPGERFAGWYCRQTLSYPRNPAEISCLLKTERPVWA